MPAPRFTPEELDRLRALAAEWGKIVSKRAFGDDGPGLDVDFRTMEQIATAAAQGLTEGTLGVRCGCGALCAILKRGHTAEVAECRKLAAREVPECR